MKKKKEIIITVDVKEPPDELTDQDAFQYSYLKWKFIVDHQVDKDDAFTLIDAYPALKNFNARCGYCEKYNVGYAMCGSCPLMINYGETKYGCYSGLHPYSKWQYAQKGSAEQNKYAQEVLNLIIKTQPD